LNRESKTKKRLIKFIELLTKRSKNPHAMYLAKVNVKKSRSPKIDSEGWGVNYIFRAGI